MNLIMRVFGHYEPLETPNLIMIVSLIIRCIMRLLAFQCIVIEKTGSGARTSSPVCPVRHL